MPLPAPISIRNHAAEDFERLYDIDRISFPRGISYSKNELRSFLSHPDSLTKVAELEGRVVGFAIAFLELRGAAHIVTLDVAPEARRRGVGTRLLESLHAELDEQGVGISVLEVNAEDTGAQAFYARLEYRRVETLPGYYPNADAYRMIRLLNRGREG